MASVPAVLAGPPDAGCLDQGREQGKAAATPTPAATGARVCSPNEPWPRADAPTEGPAVLSLSMGTTKPDKEQTHGRTGKPARGNPIPH